MGGCKTHLQSVVRPNNGLKSRMRDLLTCFLLEKPLLERGVLRGNPITSHPEFEQHIREQCKLQVVHR